jgi:GxxExxY protein
MAIDYTRLELNQLTEVVIGAAIDVHRELGPGYLESVYEAALCHELRLRKIPFERQYTFKLIYKGESVGEGRIDVLVADRLIVELKATDRVLPIHQSQVISYLKAMNLSLALIINFNISLLRNGVKRMIRN